MTKCDERQIRNIGKPEFVTVRKKVKTLMAAGYDRKYIHTKLKKDGLITMSYSTFCVQFKKFKASLEADSINQSKPNQAKPSQARPLPRTKDGPIGRACLSKPQPFFIDRSRSAEDLM